MKSLRIYLRKEDMAGNYCGGQPGDSDRCPIGRWFDRNVKTHRAHIGGTYVRLVHKITGEETCYNIVHPCAFTTKVRELRGKKGTKISIKGLTLPS